ncbi:MAG: metal ABC transporter permease [Muribaculaceae bacterium]|nr:metal ABC transporter permease [Alistipes senegalensis]MCM1474406.1 metal ABC transporter permease [Muribaculaceae bacterium]
MIEKFQYYFEFPIVRYALIVIILVSLCSSLLGVTLVLKRFSFIGDGLSHVAFGAMAVATVTGITNQMLIILPITIISAVLILRTGRNTKIRGDASTAMISVGALAIGYMLINMFSKSANVAGDVCSTLFGSTSILTLERKEVVLCTILSLIVLCVFILFYNKIFAVTFDENFSKATGINADVYNLIIAVITAIIIVLAMRLVGSLLISALIIFPSITAMRIFRSFKSVIICSAITAVFCGGTGFLISLLCGTPVGATIVTADIFVFFVFCAVSGIKK